MASAARLAIVNLMKASLLFSSLALAVFFAACSSTSSLVEKDFYPDKRPKYSIAVDKQGHKEGPETWWYPDGTKKYAATNRNGVREGQFHAWYPDGKPWYRGYEFHGKPESTLTYWHPNGKLKSEALFRDGIQLERKDYDEEGRFIAPKPLAGREGFPSPDEEAENAGAMERLRKTSLNLWAGRVRQTVEGYWVLPKQFEKERPYRAVAKIKVGKDGRILGVTWVEKSPSSAFNTMAQNTFKRIKRLPAFPPQVKDQTLEIQYEFISLGKPVPRRKLEAREDPESGAAPEE
jgi:hypothetical protein